MSAYFKVRSCGNTPYEAVDRAKSIDAVYESDSGIRTKSQIIKSLDFETEKALDEGIRQKMVPNDQYARYIDLGDGEYLFFGKVEE